MERSLPWSWYSDPEILQLEGRNIFARTWQYVGHLGQVAGESSYFDVSAGQMPVVVARGRDGELRAFLNVSRHRGHLVASGKASAAPALIDTWGPMIFVNPDVDAPPLSTVLGDVPRQLAELVDVDSLEFRFRTEFEVGANWKISCENFLECYHCSIAHPGFSAVVDVSPDAYRLESSGLVSSQFGPLRRHGDSSFAGGEVSRSQFHFLWPNFGVNVFPGKPNLSCGPMLPIGPERTARFLDYFFAPGVEQSWVDELVEFDSQVGREDTVLVESVQRGVRSGLLDNGRLLAESEQLLAHFQRLCAAALAG
jgi:choline monooxygenase